jgi:ADP-ribosylation factor-like protein 3
MLIYANKQDLISALPPEEIEELLCLGMINDRAWTIAACSAKDREGKYYLEGNNTLLYRAEGRA